jgi:hypothetical protein
MLETTPMKISQFLEGSLGFFQKLARKDDGTPVCSSALNAPGEEEVGGVVGLEVEAGVGGVEDMS